MQTRLSESLRNTHEGREAESILRACVHCGFCLATCPTYQLLGDELDSPRGRIYLIKQVVEGRQPTARTQLHLDRCLTCLSCETTCPSGVRYGRLVDIGRGLVEQAVQRPVAEVTYRRLLEQVLPQRRLFEPLLRLGRGVRPVLPATLRAHIPAAAPAGPRPAPTHRRRMLLLDGCVQPGLAPGINNAAARVLDRLGISLVSASGAGCCGAIAYHLNDHPAGQKAMRRNVDAWLPHLDQCEGILVTASGCGKQVKDYGQILANDPSYAAAAARVSSVARDVSEVLLAEKDALAALLSQAPGRGNGMTLAFHSPCSLQHGQKIRGVVEELLQLAGFRLTVVADAHLCCGSAGTYSLLQPDLSQRLLLDKLAALEAGGPQMIVSANIGCIVHLVSKAGVPVRHWVEVVDQVLGGGLEQAASPSP